LTPNCVGLLEPRGSGLGQLKSTFTAQVVLVYLQPFGRNSRLKYALQPKIAKKNSLDLSFGGSRSFKIIDVEKSKKNVTSALVMIRSKSVPICNHFHTVKVYFHYGCCTLRCVAFERV